MNKETILDYVTETPGNTNRNVLGGMLDQFSKDSSGLPEVTSEDNGDVLTVVNGEWAKAEPGGGSSIKLYVTEPPTTDPGVPEAWLADDTITKGLSNTISGDALTISELNEIIESYDIISVVLYSDAEGAAVFNSISRVYINEDAYKAAYIEILVSESSVAVSKCGAGFSPGEE